MKPVNPPAMKRIKSGQAKASASAPPAFQRVQGAVNRAADKYKKRIK